MRLPSLLLLSLTILLTFALLSSAKRPPQTPGSSQHDKKSLLKVVQQRQTNAQAIEERKRRALSGLRRLVLSSFDLSFRFLGLALAKEV